MNIERIEMLQNLIIEFETLKKNREELIPTNPFEERLLVIIKEMDEANIKVIEIIEKEIEKEMSKPSVSDMISAREGFI